MTALEGDVYIDRLADFSEAGACGTAAIISPIGGIQNGTDFHVFYSETEVGPVTKQLYDELVGIQFGDKEAPEGWIVKFKETKEREFMLSFCVEYSEFSIKRLTLILFKGIMEDTRFKKEGKLLLIKSAESEEMTIFLIKKTNQMHKFKWALLHYNLVKNGLSWICSP